MATVSPFLTHAPAPDGFAEALNGLIVGVVGLEFARRALATSLDHDDGAAAPAQGLLDEAYHDGRLGAEEYEALTADINRYLGEDVPTEWSQDLVSEAAPASDTLAPGEAAPESRAAASGGLFPGAVLRDRFVLQARLGTTGTSDIFKAIDRRRQEAHAESPWVALKLAIPGTPRYEDSLRLLQREAALAQRLEHPNIVRVFDFDRDGGHAFLTMEWLDGESLADLLTRQRYRPLTVPHARQILAEVADALAFAHGRGITHADVKPGNIFITRGGGTRLLDFGTARSSADAPQAADARTPAYASCEVLEGEPPTPCDDVYSLACVAYRMLAGRRVFGHHDALAAEQSGRRPAPIRNLTAAQSAALARALAFRRADRTPDMATFIAEFIASTEVRRPVPTYRAAPATAPEPAAVIAAPAAPAGATPARRLPLRGLAATAAALLVGAALWWQAGGDPGEVTAPATTRPAAAPVKDAPVAATPAAPVQPVAPPPPAMTPPVTRARAPQPAPARADVEGRAARPRESRNRTDAAPNSPPVTGTPAQPAADAVATVAAAPAVATSAEPPPAAEAAAMTTPAPAPADTGPPEVSLSDLTLRRYVKPAEPRRARRNDAPGFVELRFVVGTDGTTRDVRVTGSRPAGVYDDAALSAVQRWRFEPVIEDGRAVERRTAVRLRFQPED